MQVFAFRKFNYSVGSTNYLLKKPTLLAKNNYYYKERENEQEGTEHISEATFGFSLLPAEQRTDRFPLFLPIKREILNCKQSATELHLYFLPSVWLVIRHSDKNTTCGSSYNFDICYFKLIFRM